MLKLKPRIYHRLSILLNNSQTFKKKENAYAQEIRNPPNGIIAHDAFKNAAEQLNEEYSLGITNEEKEFVIPLLEYRLRAMSNDDGKIGTAFKNDELTITIRAPITKKEFECLWETRIKSQQENFVLGFGTDMDEFYKHYEKTKIKRFNSHKKRKGEKDRYQELLEKRRKINLTEEEQKEFSELRAEYNKIELFKYTNNLENIDEDLLILRLSKLHKSIKLAEDEYHKIKLADYIKQRDGLNIKFNPTDRFSSLVAKHITENELLKFSKATKNTKTGNSDILYKLIRAKNFQERLREIKTVYLLS